MDNPGPLKRSLYQPSHEKGPVPNGDDVVAVKRAISRAGFWPWQQFSGEYSNDFADNGVKPFQRSRGIQATGAYGEDTHNALRWCSIACDLDNAGQWHFDGTAVRLYQGYQTPPPPASEDAIRAAMTDFCEQGIGEPDWYYSQARAIQKEINPNGPATSDCSGSVIQIYWWAKKKTGANVPDPSQQGWSGYGNTNYYEDDWPTVTSGQYRVGDLAHYDGHVCLCYHPGDADSADWWSFGSEPPSKRKIHYRTDFRKVVRPPLTP